MRIRAFFLGSYTGRFHGIPIFESAKLGFGRNRAALTLPGLGIVVAQGAYSQNLDHFTLRHEYGHILQCRHTGYLKFYLFVGIPSLFSAWTNWHKKGHQNYWTELWCNHLSRQYFGADGWPDTMFPARDIKSKSKFWLVKSKYRPFTFDK